MFFYSICRWMHDSIPSLSIITEGLQLIMLVRRIKKLVKFTPSFPMVAFWYLWLVRVLQLKFSLNYWICCYSRLREVGNSAPRNTYLSVLDDHFRRAAEILHSYVDLCSNLDERNNLIQSILTRVKNFTLKSPHNYIKNWYYLKIHRKFKNDYFVKNSRLLMR